jgi:hypothetical protein
MDRTTGIILTIVTVLLCACPGLVALGLGAVSALGGFPGMAPTGIDPGAAVAGGIALVCIGVIGLLAPVLVAVLTLRRPRRTPPSAGPDEPLPPPY